MFLFLEQNFSSSPTVNVKVRQSMFDKTEI